MDEKMMKLFEEMAQNIRDVKQMSSRLDVMDAKLDAMQSEIAEVKSDISAIRLTIESEIRTNISLIAEGHASLDRKMGYIITDMAKLSQMEIRLNTALSEISQLKKAVGIG